MLWRILHPCDVECTSSLLSQYPGWSQAPDGSIRVAEATEDSLGTYTCMPYNALGTMGQSDPAILVLKVLVLEETSDQM